MQPTQIQQTQQSVASNQNHIKQEPIHQKPSNLVTAQRVAEILKAAGETFCRLGECTMMLDQSANPNKTKVCQIWIFLKQSRFYINGSTLTGCKPSENSKI